jgi:hypothetical protein
LAEVSSCSDEPALSRAQAGAIGGVLIFVVLLVMGLVAVSYIPISPEITAYVQVSTTSNGQPAITLLSIGYQKVTLAVSAGEPKDHVQISQVAASTATTGVLPPPSGYVLTVTVYYLGQVVLYGNMTSVTNGLYLIKASFWPRSEQASIPYTIHIDVSQGSYFVEVVSNLLPS